MTQMNNEEENLYPSSEEVNDTELEQNVSEEITGGMIEVPTEELNDTSNDESDVIDMGVVNIEEVPTEDDLVNDVLESAYERTNLGQMFDGTVGEFDRLTFKMDYLIGVNRSTINLKKQFDRNQESYVDIVEEKKKLDTKTNNALNFIKYHGVVSERILEQERDSYLAQLPELIERYDILYSNFIGINNHIVSFYNSLSKNLEKAETEIQNYNNSLGAREAIRDNMFHNLETSKKNFEEKFFNLIENDLNENYETSDKIFRAQESIREYAMDINNKISQTTEEEKSYLSQIEDLNSEIYKHVKDIRETVNKYSNFIGLDNSVSELYNNNLDDFIGLPLVSNSDDFMGVPYNDKLDYSMNRLVEAI